MPALPLRQAGVAGLDEYKFMHSSGPGRYRQPWFDNQSV